MKRLIPLLILFVVVMASSCTMQTTGDTEVGVRTRKISLFAESGVEDRAYAAGSTYFFVPFINDWHTFDTKLQNLEMTLDSGSGDRRNRDDLLFKTIDGNDISLDVIVAYRIDPDKAPYILQYVAENDQELREKIIRTLARSIPRDIFGELTSEEFYVASERQEKAEEARARLQEILEPLGVIVEKVLPKDYRFNEAYQQAIEDRKVAEQLAERNVAATEAAREEYNRKLHEAQGTVNEMVARADGQYEQARIEADAYYTQQEYLAQAIEAEAQAEAEGIRRLNEALAGAGGETMVKLEIAEALAGKRIVLLPTSEGGFNLRTLDLNRLLESFGGGGGSQGGWSGLSSESGVTGGAGGTAGAGSTASGAMSTNPGLVSQ